MNRGGAMAAAIKPVRAGMRMVGQARTASIMVGDNSILHLALREMQPGDVLVIDGGGALEVALWGGVLNAAAKARKIGGVVIDGAARDAAELRDADLPIYCRGFTPRGPHKGFGGVFDAPAAVGGAPVSSGDIVIGDDDGVVVVPIADRAAVLDACRANLAKEARWLSEIESGADTPTILGVPGFTT